MSARLIILLLSTTSNLSYAAAKCWNTHLRNILTTGPEKEQSCVGHLSEYDKNRGQLTQVYIWDRESLSFHDDDDIVVLVDQKGEDLWLRNREYDGQYAVTNGINIVISSKYFDGAYFIGSIKQNKWFRHYEQKENNLKEAKVKYFVIFQSQCQVDDKALMLKLAEFDWDYYDYCSSEEEALWVSDEGYRKDKEFKYWIFFKNFMYQPPLITDEIVKLAQSLKSTNPELTCSDNGSCTYQINKKLKKFAFAELAVEYMSTYMMKIPQKRLVFMQDEVIDSSQQHGWFYVLNIFEIDKIQFQGDTQVESKYKKAEWLQKDFFCGLVYTQQGPIQEAVLILLYPGDNFIVTKSHFQSEDFYYKFERTTRVTQVIVYGIVAENALKEAQLIVSKYGKRYEEQMQYQAEVWKKENPNFRQLPNQLYVQVNEAFVQDDSGQLLDQIQNKKSLKKKAKKKSKTVKQKNQKSAKQIFAS